MQISIFFGHRCPMNFNFPRFLLFALAICPWSRLVAQAPAKEASPPAQDFKPRSIEQILADAKAQQSTGKTDAADKGKLQVGAKMPTLVLRDGTKFTNVQITSISTTDVCISHSEGVSRFPLMNLPSAVSDHLAKGSSPGLLNTTSKSGPRPEPKWKPKSLDDVAKCTVMIKTDLGAGTGFLLNDYGSTYVYTNIHVLDGAKQITIKDDAGNEYKDIEYMEAAASPCGYVKDGGGGDAVRLKLIDFRERALTQRDIATPAEIIGKTVGMTGNGGGRGALTQLTGVVGKCGDQSFQNTTPGEPGNSGSPVVRMDTFEVIGMHTYGMRAPENPLTMLWQKEMGATAGVSFALRLDALNRWQQLSVSAFFAQMRKFDEFKQLVLLCGLIDFLQPTSSGIFAPLNLQVQVMGSPYTIGELLAIWRDHPIVSELTALDRVLARNRNTSAKMSKVDINKSFVKALRGALNGIVERREKLVGETWIYYMEIKRERSLAIPVCQAYEVILARQAQWYNSQISVGGRTTSERPRLPAFNDGAIALGIRR